MDSARGSSLLSCFRGGENKATGF